MQKQKNRFFVLFAILLFALLTPAAALAVDTTASVVFSDGLLEMQDPSPEKQGMDIDFGEQTLPTGAVEYPSTNGPHTLRVSDARGTSTAWEMTVKATPFTTKDPVDPTEFPATIELTEKSSPDITGLTCVEPVIIVTDNTEIKVLEATDTAGRGLHDTTWEKENVLLKISNDDYLDVRIASYEATLTWTLEIN